MTQGNKFIVEGTVKGTKNALISLFGNEKSLLYVNAKCVHVWETGQSSLSKSPDSDYLEARRKTFCADQ